MAWSRKIDNVGTYKPYLHKVHYPYRMISVVAKETELWMYVPFHELQIRHEPDTNSK